MSSTASPASPSHAPTLQTQYSCVLCKKRKVRCDKTRPCSGCVRAGVQCVPGSRAPYKRRKRLHSEASPEVQPGAGQEVQEQNLATERQSQAIASAPSRAPTFSDNLWTGLQHEVSTPSPREHRQIQFREPARLAETPMAESQQTSIDGTPYSDPSSFIFGAGSPAVDLRDSHPSPVHSFILWQVFLQNVNPLSKVVHAPLVQDQVVEASRDFASIPINTQALLFAVYAAAVVSMKGDECEMKLGESRKILLSRYLSATQKALTAASFMRATNLVVLQAFTLYLLAARQIYDAQAMWILTGMAVRMARRLQLWSKDTSSHFETQLCRRVLWQIMLTDGRTSQLSGLRPSASEWADYPLPANLNDSDISPDMTEMPPDYDRPTEMTFCLTKYELGKFLIANSEKLNSPTTSISDKDRLLDELEGILEQKYLKHCDPAIPLHQVAAGGARSATSKLRMMAHHPCQYPDKGKSMPQSEHDLLFSLSVTMNELHVIGYSKKAVQKFLWHIDVYFQLDAFVFMLIESRSQLPTAAVTEKAWGLVTEIFKYRPELMRDDGNELHSSVRQLVLRAWDTREAEARRRGLGPLTPTPVISKLREVVPRPDFGHQNTSAVVISRGTESNNFASEEGRSATMAPTPAQDTSYPVAPLDNLGRHGDGDMTSYGWDFMDWQSWDYWSDLIQSQVSHPNATQI